jgi:membrane protease YdiL (CAAX protease family)
MMRRNIVSVASNYESENIMQTTSRPSLVTPLSVSTTTRVNWPHVAWFLGLTFALTWLADLVLYWNGGLAGPVTSLLLQFQMLLPAFSAMLLGAFFFQESPLYYRSNRTASRWFVYFYLLLTGLYSIGLMASLIRPEQTATISALLLIPNLIGLILLVVLRWRGGREAFSGAGLAGGKWRVWLVYGVGLIAFYGLQTLLNYVFKLGQVVDLKAAFPQMAAANLPAPALMLSMAINTLIVGPFLGLIITFGEEYGWRGYLQTELTRLGRVRGVFLLGVIWGVWHWPVIWMGYNYPGQPVLGSIAMVLMCVILAYFLAYAVFKSNGIWTAAYLHALSNQAFSFFAMTMVVPTSMLFSFGIGLPSLVLGAIFVLLILRDPVWKVSEPAREG